MQARQRAAEFQRVAEMQVLRPHTRALMSRAASHPCNMRRVCNRKYRDLAAAVGRVGTTLRPAVCCICAAAHAQAASVCQTETWDSTLLCAGCSARRRCSESQRCSGRRSSRSSTAP